MLRVFLLLIPCLCFGENLKPYMEFTEQWEGRRNAVYVCPAGFKTIGVGHRLLKNENFSYLTEDEIDAIYEQDIKTALNDAKSLICNFDDQPMEVRLILVDLAFNLGLTKLTLFEKTLDSCRSMDYITMSDELKDSKWYNQTGHRGKHHIEKLKGIVLVAQSDRASDF